MQGGAEMTDFFLGADLGATKTHVVVADAAGRVLGFGRSGPGNHEAVGYAGFQANLQTAVRQALEAARLKPAVPAELRRGHFDQLLAPRGYSQ